MHRRFYALLIFLALISSAQSATTVKFSADVLSLASQNEIILDDKKIILCGVLNEYSASGGGDGLEQLRRLTQENKKDLPDNLELIYSLSSPGRGYGVLYNRALNIQNHSINEILIREGINRTRVNSPECEALLPGERLSILELAAQKSRVGVWASLGRQANDKADENFDCQLVVRFVAPSTITLVIDSYHNVDVDINIITGKDQKNFSKTWNSGRKKLSFPHAAAQPIELSLQYNKNRRNFCPVALD